MSEQAQPQDHELKSHGDELESALKPTPDADESQPQEPAKSGTNTKE